MKFLYIVFTIFLLAGCAQKKLDMQTKEPIKETILDLSKISQNPSYFSKDIKASYISSQLEYEKKYFKVWNINKGDTSLKEAMWAHRVYDANNSYGENLQPRKQAFFDALLSNANFDAYQTLNLKALSLKKLNIRSMPSDEVILMNPKRAGEGFPFDYLQNSTIAANKPLLISHYSKDKKWAFVESSFAFGWVHSSDIVSLDDVKAQLWQRAQQVIITQDNVPIYSQNNQFLFHSQIGQMFALIDEDEKSFTVLTISKYKNSQAYFKKSKLSKEMAHKGILEFNSENITKIMNQLSKSEYGWGGMYAQRDCSSTLRDFFAPFGVWLPRNSYKQSLVGNVISLKNLSNDAKITFIKDKAVPFRTLVYKQGHIALYVGNYDDKVIIYQNVWGVKTIKDGKNGRYVIGRPVFSTLEIGKNLQDYDTNASLLSNLESISTL